MRKEYLDNLVGVFGHPVAENPTTVMFSAAFRALKLDWKYLTMDVEEKDLPDAMRGVRALHFRGINLTIPHKVKVLPLLDRVAQDAALMGAVNTVRCERDMLIGENTDGKGFLRSLREDARVEPKGRRIVVLGAGGAARAISVELGLAGAEKIIIVNRTERRGKELVALLNAKTQASAEYVKWDSTFKLDRSIHILINATSIGLYPNTTQKPDIDFVGITDKMVVCDVIPNPPNTPFLLEAKKRGAKTLDGMGMLVYQGAIAFKMWTGREAPVDKMEKALRKEFGV